MGKSSLSRLPLHCHRHRHHPPPRPPSVQSWTSRTSPPPPVPQPQSGPISNPVQDSLTYKDPVCKNGYREHSLRGTLRCYHRLSPPSLLTRSRGGGGLWRFPQPTRVCVGRGPHQAFSLASPPPPPPIHPSTELHTCCSALRPLALHGLASHMPHTYTQSGPPLVCLHVFLILIHLRSYYNPATPRAGGYLARVVAVFNYLITPFLILRLATIRLDSFCFFGSF